VFSGMIGVTPFGLFLKLFNCVVCGVI